MTACPECLRSTPCEKCAAGERVRNPCPGDGTHYFHKDEAPCRLCKRYLADHESENLR